jgi:hypothetical protein
MTDTYRALCAELLDELQALRLAVAYEVGCPSPEPPVVLRARTALNQPEPVAPTDEKLLTALKAAIVAFPPRHPEAKPLSADEYEVELEIRKARAVLARWGTPANTINQEDY